MFFKGWRIGRGGKTRTGEQPWVAVLGTVALVEKTDEKLRARIEERTAFDTGIKA